MSAVQDRNAAYGFGNYYFDKKRHEDAVAIGKTVPPFATICHNLGIAYWNGLHNGPAVQKAA